MCLESAPSLLHPESSSPGASYQTLTPYPPLVDLSPSRSSTSTGHLHTLTPYPPLFEPSSQTAGVATPTCSNSSSSLVLPAVAPSIGGTNVSLDSHISQIMGELTGGSSSRAENVLGHALFTITATNSNPQLIPSHPSLLQLPPSSTSQIHLAAPSIATPTSTQLPVSSVFNSLSSIVLSPADPSHLPAGSQGEERRGE